MERYEIRPELPEKISPAKSDEKVSVGGIRGG